MHPVFHVSLLREYTDNGLHQVPPPIQVDGEEEWEIEAIVGHRTFRGQPQYLVAFVGFDVSENAWLAEEQLSNASDLLSAYKLS